MSRVASPASRRLIASRFWWGVSLGLRPSLTPFATARAAFSGARADQLALKLGEAPEYGEHQAAVRRGGVGPRVAKRSKSGTLAGDRREGVQEVARRIALGGRGA
jgi:hypothetical protein